MRSDGIFIAVEVDDQAAVDPALAAKRVGWIDRPKIDATAGLDPKPITKPRGPALGWEICARWVIGVRSTVRQPSGPASASHPASAVVVRPDGGRSA